MRLIAASLLLVLSAPAQAVVFDSFEGPLPSNPSLVPGKAILFLGPVCNGVTCPPDPTVDNEDGVDFAVQSGLSGVPQGYRESFISSRSGDASDAQAIAEIRGGSLHLANTGLTQIGIQLVYGNAQHQMELDLAREGTDRFEIDIASEAPTFTPFVIQFFWSTIFGPSNSEARAFLIDVPVTGPGTIVLPYSAFQASTEDALLYFVDKIDFRILQFVPGNAIRIGEIRTGASSTSTTASSWGRIKAGYR